MNDWALNEQDEWIDKELESDLNIGQLSKVSFFEVDKKATHSNSNSMHRRMIQSPTFGSQGTESTKKETSLSDQSQSVRFVQCTSFRCVICLA